MRPVHVRSRARSWALQLLYGWEMGGGEGTPSDYAARALRRRRMAPRYRPYVERIIGWIESHSEEIDRVLANAVANWRVERLDAIDRTILRIGIAELLYGEDVPPKVAIHEAIRLASRYGSADSAGFVNGVLDAVHRGEARPGSARPAE